MTKGEPITEVRTKVLVPRRGRAPCRVFRYLSLTYTIGELAEAQAACEGTSWIRGHHGVHTEEAQALLAANTLAGT